MYAAVTIAYVQPPPPLSAQNKSELLHSSAMIIVLFDNTASILNVKIATSLASFVKGVFVFYVYILLKALPNNVINS